MLSAAARLRSLPGGRGSVAVGPDWLPVFEASRDGAVSTLAPGPGLAVLMIGLPLAAAGATLLLARRFRG